jgi:hypothetical protein
MIDLPSLVVADRERQTHFDTATIDHLVVGNDDGASSFTRAWRAPLIYWVA